MRLVIADPGHFHAALLQKEMYAGLDNRVSVYAPLGPEVIDYLSRVSRFNLREKNPTHWELDIHLSPDPMGQLLRNQRPGDIVIFAGRNRPKIDRVLAALSAGMHVLCDKPWTISAANLPKLEEALTIAERNRLIAYDIMTERYEATSELQRLFVNDPEVFGAIDPGSASNPGVAARSVHNIMKTVAGVPLRRPAWFFDVDDYGDGLADVGTHVVDLVQWTAFPGELVDYRSDIQLLSSGRWPITLTSEQFGQVTGEARDGTLDYYCNNSVHYTLRGVHVKLEITWEWEAEGGRDIYEAAFRGTKSSIEIRQGRCENFVPELYIVPYSDAVRGAVRQRITEAQAAWPGLAMVETAGEIRIVIPEQFRTGHEAHFAQVARRFFDYVRSPESIPPWERSYMLAKYCVSTRAASHRISWSAEAATQE
jgi:predicted dehydrogenase